MKSFRIILIFIIILLLQVSAFSQLTPWEAVEQMQRGINLGNTLEPPLEGDWNNPNAEEHYFDDYKTAGFRTVRVPVRWDEHTSKSAPYKVEESWMNRVEQVVEWGLSRDLFIIINAHHEEWIKTNYSAENQTRFDSIWSQISVRFKDKSDKLIFEIINEPHGLTLAEVDDLNARVLPIIRKTNPTRIVCFSGHEWAGLAQLKSAAILEDDYLMGYYHSYDPWDFGGLGEGTWGSTMQRAQVANSFSSAARWSTENDIPVIIGEFGAVHKADYNSRMLHYFTYVEEALKNNVVFQAWDDGGQFGIYERATRTWHEVKDILMHTYTDSPSYLNISANGDSVVSLSWKNRTAENNKIIIERKIGESSFQKLAELDAASESFSDSSVTPGHFYYRVISVMDNGEDKYSYPVKIFLESTFRSPYLLLPFEVPGIIEAEEFDIGGEGLTFHDTGAQNIPGKYRPAESVDIEDRDDGGYQISYVEKGEWLEYSIDVAKAGLYDIKVETASLNGGGKLRFRVGFTYSTVLDVVSTNDWQNTVSIYGQIELAEGEQILRMEIGDVSPFNIDKFELIFNSIVGIENNTELPVSFELQQNYPNPFNPTTTINYAIAESGEVSLKVFDVLGNEVSTLVDGYKPKGIYSVSFNAANLSSGIYYYTISTREFRNTKTMILLK
ncbi:MAG: cellulase family glycosylhydrolase [Melioribacteraceae bacterium]|nr:cellulase family glycosylhydrolase [Melioribacteraceae bacterium]